MSSENSDLAVNIHGKSLSATILPIIGSLGKTCSGRFQSPTDFTPQKTGYSYSFFAQRCHENIIYLQCYATYNSTIEIYNYDINAATWKYMGSTITYTDMAVSTINGSVKTTNDWTTNFARAKKSGHAVALKIDATAKTASSGWITVASGLPAAADDFFYQGYDDGHGGYKIKIDTSGNLLLSNRSGKVATYVDTVISYIAV